MKKFITICLICMGTLVPASAFAKKISTPIKTATLSKKARLKLIAKAHFGKPYHKLTYTQRVGVMWAAERSKVIFSNECGGGHFLVWDDKHIGWGIKWWKNRKRKRAPKPKVVVKKKIVVKKVVVVKTRTVVKRVVVKKTHRGIYKERPGASLEGYYLEHGMNGHRFAQGGGSAYKLKLFGSKGFAVGRLELGADWFGADIFCGGWFEGRGAHLNLLGGVIQENSLIRFQLLAGIGGEFLNVNGSKDGERFELTDAVAKGILMSRLDAKWVSLELRSAISGGAHYLYKKSPLVRLEGLGVFTLHASDKVDLSVGGGIRHDYMDTAKTKKKLTKIFGKGCVRGELHSNKEAALYGKACVEHGKYDGYVNQTYLKPGVGLEVEF